MNNSICPICKCEMAFTNGKIVHNPLCDIYSLPDDKQLSTIAQALLYEALKQGQIINIHNNCNICGAGCDIPLSMGKFEADKVYKDKRYKNEEGNYILTDIVMSKKRYPVCVLMIDNYNENIIEPLYVLSATDIIKGHIITNKRQYECKEHVYVLKLEGDKYYIGYSTNVKHRIDEHMHGNGAEWTKIYKPLEVVEILAYDEFKEEMITKKYMKLYGIDNVRGGPYVKINLKNSDIIEIERSIFHNDNACMKCGSKEHFAANCDKHDTSSHSNDSTDEYYSEEEDYYHIRGACYRCGRLNHIMRYCHARYTINGKLLK